MIKPLEDAIEKVRTLPIERQKLAAAVLEQIAAVPSPYQVPDDDLEAVLAGSAQAVRGEFASPSDADAVLRKPWR